MFENFVLLVAMSTWKAPITHQTGEKIFGVHQFPCWMTYNLLGKKTNRTSHYSKVTDIEEEASGRDKPISAHSSLLSL